MWVSIVVLTAAAAYLTVAHPPSRTHPSQRRPAHSSTPAPRPPVAQRSLPLRTTVEVSCTLHSPDRGPLPALDQLVATASDGSWTQPVWPRLVPDTASTWQVSVWLDQLTGATSDLQFVTLHDAVIEPLRLRIEGGVCTAPPLHFQPGVTCALGPELHQTLSALREGIDWAVRGEDGDHLATRRNGDRLTIWPPSPTGRGRLLLPGQPAAPLRWTKGVCAPLNTTPTATLQGRLIDPLDQGGPYFVVGCGTQALVQDDLSFTLQIAAAEPCQVEAWRMDGPLRALSEPAEITLEPGTTRALELRLPEVRMAGLGIAFRVEDGGVRTLKVHDGSPAWEAGLREGDLIIEVDGQPTPGMSDNDFVAFGTGPSGSVARLVIADDAGTSTVEVRRGELRALLR